MTANLVALLGEASRALPKGALKTRIEDQLATRATYTERARKAWATMRAAKLASQPKPPAPAATASQKVKAPPAATKVKATKAKK